MLSPQENHYTYADLLTWDDNERYELIEGRPMMMSAPSDLHAEVSGEIHRQLSNYLLGKNCKVRHAPYDVRLFEENGDLPEDVDTVVQPDITVVCDPEKRDNRGCKGAPDLVIEILSPSSKRYDRFTKFTLYQRAGVQEYWIVDPDDKSVQIFLLEDERYTFKAYGEGKDVVKVNVLDDCTVDLSLVFPE